MGKRITKNQFQNAVKIIEAYKNQLLEETEFIKSAPLVYNESTKLYDVNVSTRLYNFLYSYNYREVAFGKSITDVTLLDISKLDEEKLLFCRNFGTKTLKELKAILSCAGLKLNNTKPH